MILGLFIIAFSCYIIKHPNLAVTDGKFDSNAFHAILALFVAISSVLIATIIGIIMLAGQDKASDEQRDDLKLIREAIDRNTAVHATTGDVPQGEFEKQEEVLPPINDAIDSDMPTQTKIKGVSQEESKSLEKTSTSIDERIGQRIQAIFDDNERLQERLNTLSNNYWKFWRFIRYRTTKRKIKLNYEEIEKLLGWLDKLKH
jgi:hypothetical protein